MVSSATPVACFDISRNRWKSIQKEEIKANSHRMKAKERAKTIKEWSEEIKGKKLNIKESFRFRIRIRIRIRIRFLLVWIGL